MMNTVRFLWFRTGCIAAAAAACLTIGALCALQAPGLTRAVMTVGADAELPLERVTTDHRELAQVNDISELQHTPTSGAGHAQAPLHPWKESSHHADANARALRHRPGYQQTITNFKSWT